MGVQPDKPNGKASASRDDWKTLLNVGLNFFGRAVELRDLAEGCVGSQSEQGYLGLARKKPMVNDKPHNASNPTPERNDVTHRRNC